MANLKLNIISFPHLKPEIKAALFDKNPEPNWSSFLLMQYPAHFQKASYLKITQAALPFSYFVRGITKEFGLLEVLINNEEALEFYEMGGEENDPFCNFRLYYIFTFDFAKFGKACDRDKGMLCLIKSVCFCDQLLDVRCELINPVSQYEMHLTYEDSDLFRSKKVLRILQERERDKPKKFNNFLFLELWLSYEYAMDPLDKEMALKELEQAAEKGNNLAGFYVGRKMMESEEKRESCQKLLIKSCEELPEMPSYHILGEINEKSNKLEEACKYYWKGVEHNEFQSLLKVSSLIVSGFPMEYKKTTDPGQLLMNAFLLGHQTAAHAFIDLTIYAKKCKVFCPIQEMEKTSLELATALFNHKKGLVSEIEQIGAQYYLLAECLRKGVGIPERNIKLALRLIEKGISDPLVVEKRALIYLQALYKWKMGEGESLSPQATKKRNMQLFESAFQMYASFIESEDLVKCSQHYFKIGKMYERGWGTKANSFLAMKFYTMGANQEHKSGILQILYAKRCRAKLQTVGLTAYDLKYH